MTAAARAEDLHKLIGLSIGADDDVTKPLLDQGVHERETFKRFKASALTATRTLDPDIEIAAISGRRVRPNGSKTPAAIGSASEL